MKINTVNTVDTVIQDFRDGQNIFRRPSVELIVREISRLQARVAELEQELKKNVEFYFDGEKNE